RDDRPGPAAQVVRGHLEGPDGKEEQGDRDGEAGRRRPGADGRVVGDEVDVDGQAGPDGRGRGEHQVVAVAPDDRGPQRGQELVRLLGEVQPPHGEHGQQPAGRRGGQGGQGRVLVQGGLDGQGGGEHALAQDDQGEQAVAFGDVAGGAGGGGGPRRPGGGGGSGVGG